MATERDKKSSSSELFYSELGKVAPEHTIRMWFKNRVDVYSNGEGSNTGKVVVTSSNDYTNKRIQEGLYQGYVKEAMNNSGIGKYDLSYVVGNVAMSNDDVKPKEIIAPVNKLENKTYNLTLSSSLPDSAGVIPHSGNLEGLTYITNVMKKLRGEDVRVPQMSIFCGEQAPFLLSHLGYRAIGNGRSAGYVDLENLSSHYLKGFLKNKALKIKATRDLSGKTLYAADADVCLINEAIGVFGPSGAIRSSVQSDLKFLINSSDNGKFVAMAHKGNYDEFAEMCEKLESGKKFGRFTADKNLGELLRKAVPISTGELKHDEREGFLGEYLSLFEKGNNPDIFEAARVMHEILPENISMVGLETAIGAAYLKATLNEGRLTPEIVNDALTGSGQMKMFGNYRTADAASKIMIPDVAEHVGECVEDLASRKKKGDLPGAKTAFATILFHAGEMKHTEIYGATGMPRASVTRRVNDGTAIMGKDKGKLKGNDLVARNFIDEWVSKNGKLF